MDPDPDKWCSVNGAIVELKFTGEYKYWYLQLKLCKRKSYSPRAYIHGGLRDSYRGRERGDSPLLNQHKHYNKVHKQQQSDKCCSKKLKGMHLFKDPYN